MSDRESAEALARRVALDLEEWASRPRNNCHPDNECEDECRETWLSDAYEAIARLLAPALTERDAEILRMCDQREAAWIETTTAKAALAERDAEAASPTARPRGSHGD